MLVSFMHAINEPLLEFSGFLAMRLQFGKLQADFRAAKEHMCFSFDAGLEKWKSWIHFKVFFMKSAWQEKSIPATVTEVLKVQYNTPKSWFSAWDSTIWPCGINIFAKSDQPYQGSRSTLLTFFSALWLVLTSENSTQLRDQTWSEHNSSTKPSLGEVKK